MLNNVSWCIVSRTTRLRAFLQADSLPPGGGGGGGPAPVPPPGAACGRGGAEETLLLPGDPEPDPARREPALLPG